MGDDKTLSAIRSVVAVRKERYCRIVDGFRSAATGERSVSAAVPGQRLERGFIHALGHALGA